MADAARVAVVTGGNRGMGLETVRQLAKLGIEVMLTSRDPEAGAAAVTDLAESGLSASVQPLDVTDQGQIEALVERIARQFGRLDILVNNAGILPDSRGHDGHRASVLVTPMELMRSAYETNTLGPMRLCQALVPLMRKNGYGRIVNVSSAMGQLSEMGGEFPGYRLSKAALNALTRILAAELAGTDIKVNAACPGWVRTDMGGADATRSLAEGVDTTVWLATVTGEDAPNGGFFRDRDPIPW